MAVHQSETKLAIVSACFVWSKVKWNTVDKLKNEEDTDNFQEGVIRRRIHRFYTDKTFPTMSLLHAALVH